MHSPRGVGQDARINSYLEGIFIGGLLRVKEGGKVFILHDVQQPYEVHQVGLLCVCVYVACECVVCVNVCACVCACVSEREREREYRNSIHWSVLS